MLCRTETIANRWDWTDREKTSGRWSELCPWQIVFYDCKAATPNWFILSLLCYIVLPSWTVLDIGIQIQCWSMPSWLTWCACQAWWRHIQKKDVPRLHHVVSTASHKGRLLSTSCSCLMLTFIHSNVSNLACFNPISPLKPHRVSSKPILASGQAEPNICLSSRLSRLSLSNLNGSVMCSLMYPKPRFTKQGLMDSAGWATILAAQGLA